MVAVIVVVMVVAAMAVGMEEGTASSRCIAVADMVVASILTAVTGVVTAQSSGVFPMARWNFPTMEGTSFSMTGVSSDVIMTHLSWLRHRWE